MGEWFHAMIADGQIRQLLRATADEPVSYTLDDNETGETQVRVVLEYDDEGDHWVHRAEDNRDVYDSDEETVEYVEIVDSEAANEFVVGAALFRAWHADELPIPRRESDNGGPAGGEGGADAE